ncbi:MAG TPA: tRNA lysidine(34) synthetase TilS, partial [Acidobacteriaceae bacterium]
MRLAVAVSGGADSVALLRALHLQPSHGLTLTVLHMHHGIRGADADADQAFVSELAARLGLRFFARHVDGPLLAHQAGKGLEETARRLRYAWFGELLHSGEVDAVATAHTRNDQAETVLHKLLRGAWTEGLGGTHPVLALDPAAPGSSSSRAAPPSPQPPGFILRPLLQATREEIVAWLQAIGQPWQQDATNLDLRHTRNRIRHELLPQLATYNPQIIRQLANLSAIARDEEAYWQLEVHRRLPELLLPGRAVRGGGRASSTLPGERSLAIEAERLRALQPALRRRLLRAVAAELGVALDFDQTERLVLLAEARAAIGPRREELTGQLHAERTARELRLLYSAAAPPAPPAAVLIPVPGSGQGFGWHVQCSLPAGEQTPAEPARLRAVRLGDKVQL